MKTLHALSAVLFILVGVITAQDKPDTNVCNPCMVRIAQGVAEKMLLHRVEPQYPQEAISSRVSGAIDVGFVIDKQGNTARVFALRPSPEPDAINDPAVIAAVVKAVKEWKFKPYLLNGKPEAVETIFIFHMNLGGAAK
jgi:periplasmic protein TonB